MLATQLENGLKLHEDKLTVKMNALEDEFTQKVNSLDSNQSLFEDVMNGSGKHKRALIRDWIKH